LRVAEIDLGSEVWRRRLRGDLKPYALGQFEEIVEMLVAAEIPNHVKRLDEVGGHIFIRLRQHAGQDQVLDFAVIFGGKGESLHVEKEPVRLKEPSQILRLDPLQQIRLSKALKFEVSVW
jgi:hypothetical protein